jgi:glycosyltransferase involved in cell wall biosynthesis
MNRARFEPLHLVYRDRPAGTDGIREYAAQLIAYLHDGGQEARLLLCSPKAALGSRRQTGLVDADNLMPSDVPTSGVLLLQYNPFSYGRWGFAPWLPLAIWNVKRRAPRLRMALMVHEPYVPLRGWKFTIMGVWQRLQLLALLLSAEVTFVSAEEYAPRVRRHLQLQRVHHLPVGSNLPDMRSFRYASREQLGISEETIALAAFGTGHPSRLMHYVAEAAERIRDTGHNVVVLNLGADTRALEGIDPSVRVHTPGPLASEVVARQLAAGDLFVAPFEDGVSTRRTSLMAALQHALPVIGTDGELTDAILRRSPDALKLIPAGRPDLFADAARQLARDPEGRRRMGRTGRALYERFFDWPVIAARLIRTLREGAAGDDRQERLVSL